MSCREENTLSISIPTTKAVEPEVSPDSVVSWAMGTSDPLIAEAHFEDSPPRLSPQTMAKIDQTEQCTLRLMLIVVEGENPVQCILQLKPLRDREDCSASSETCSNSVPLGVHKARSRTFATFAEVKNTVKTLGHQVEGLLEREQELVLRVADLEKQAATDVMLNVVGESYVLLREHAILELTTCISNVLREYEEHKKQLVAMNKSLELTMEMKVSEMRTRVEEEDMRDEQLLKHVHCCEDFEQKFRAHKHAALVLSIICEEDVPLSSLEVVFQNLSALMQSNPSQWITCEDPKRSKDQRVCSEFVTGVIPNFAAIKVIYGMRNRRFHIRGTPAEIADAFYRALPFGREHFDLLPREPSDKIDLALVDAMHELVDCVSDMYDAHEFDNKLLSSHHHAPEEDESFGGEAHDQLTVSLGEVVLLLEECSVDKLDTFWSVPENCTKCIAFLSGDRKANESKLVDAFVKVLRQKDASKYARPSKISRWFKPSMCSKNGICERVLSNDCLKEAVK